MIAINAVSENSGIALKSAFAELLSSLIPGVDEGVICGVADIVGEGDVSAGKILFAYGEVKIPAISAIIARKIITHVARPFFLSFLRSLFKGIKSIAAASKKADERLSPDMYAP